MTSELAQESQSCQALQLLPALFAGCRVLMMMFSIGWDQAALLES